MVAISKQRLEFATVGFLAEMRKQWVILFPNEPCPIKALTDYPPEQRSALMAGIQKSIQYADPGTDQTFQAWTVKRQERESGAAE